jgi:hypothetical protein
MRPSEVIERLKSTRTTLSLLESDFHVLGASDLQKASESGDFIQNAKAVLYVYCASSSSSLVTDAGLGSNEVLHSFGVTLYTRAQDINSQYSDQMSVWFKEYLTRSLVGFDNGNGQPLTFGGDTFNTTSNVASYTRTFQFSQRVFIDGEDLIGDGDADDLDDFTRVFQTMTANTPDFNEETPATGVDINLRRWQDFKTWLDANTWQD